MTHPETFEAVLFDMDGTLVDSTSVVERIWTAFAARHHLDPVEVLRFAHGRPTAATVSNFVNGADAIATDITLVAAAEATDTAGVREVAGAHQFLSALHGLWAVVTSATPPITQLRMTAAGLPTPPLLVTAEDVSQGKPSPEGYRLAATKLGVDIEHCLIFEDAGPGIAAAVASGGTVVVVGNYQGENAAGLIQISDFSTTSIRNGVLHTGVTGGAGVHRA